LWLLRRGRVALAAGLLVVAFFTFCTTLAATSTGVPNPAYTLGYGTTIVLAGASADTVDTITFTDEVFDELSRR